MADPNVKCERFQRGQKPKATFLLKLFLLLSCVCVFLATNVAAQSPSQLPAHCSVQNPDRKVPYPESLKGSGIHGTVVLEVVIGTDGCTEDVRVIRKLHPELDRIAKEAVGSWKFHPAMKNGRPVRVKVAASVEFEERNDEAKAVSK